MRNLSLSGFKDCRTISAASEKRSLCAPRPSVSDALSLFIPPISRGLNSQGANRHREASLKLMKLAWTWYVRGAHKEQTLPTRRPDSPNHLTHVGDLVRHEWQKACVTKISPDLRRKKKSPCPCVLRYQVQHFGIALKTQYHTFAGFRAAKTVKQLTQEAMTSTGGEITVVNLVGEHYTQ